MLRKCSSACSYKRKRIVIEEHYTVCQHSTPFGLNGPMIFLVFCNTKRGWADRRQTSLTHSYKNLFPDPSASVPAVTILRSSLSMYVLSYIRHLFLLCLF
jgi:hypothetical protein